MSSVVASANSFEYSHPSIRQAVDSVISMINPGIGQLIKPGDKVVLKPYLSVAGLRTHDGSDRRVSHPLVVTAMVELLKDCGAVISVGDEGSKSFRHGARQEGREWLYALEKRYGVTLVSFAKAGAARVRSKVSYPSHYLITKALLEADAVVSCVNCRPHPRLMLMGAVRNMFNAVVGHCQTRLYQVCRAESDLARVVADICGVIRPTISLLDMTTVWDPETKKTRPTGLILASTDPVAADTVAARVFGWHEQTIWTSVHAARQGLGCAEMEHIQLKGVGVEPFTREPLASAAQRRVRPSEGAAYTRYRAVSVDFLGPRPVVFPGKCTQCGDCRIICPVDAVVMARDAGYGIRHDRCENCHLCVECCPEQAIRLQHVGLAKFIYQPKRWLDSLWERAKVGIRLPIGPLSLSMKLGRQVRVTRDINPGPPERSRGQDHPRPGGHQERTAAEAAPRPLREDPYRAQVALVVGAGHGLGSALARCFAQAGMAVAIAARNAEKLQSLVEDLQHDGVHACAYGCDAQWEPSVKGLFEQIDKDFGRIDLVVYNVEHFTPGGILEIQVAAFEECWRAMCLGGFVVGKEAARRMLPQKSGTIIFTGATASMRGRDGYINLAVGKFGVRALAQSMARELGPKGVHVAHVVIDGGIFSPRSNPGAEEQMSSLFPEEIANSVLHLHQQHPSAWSQEIDLRPWVERF